MTDFDIVKAEGDAPAHKNLRVWNSVTGAEVASFSQKLMDGW